MDGWMDGLGGCTDGRMVGWLDGWMVGWLDGRKNQLPPLHNGEAM